MPLEASIDATLAAPASSIASSTPCDSEIDDDDGAHGLCLYGAATGHEELDPAVAAELPGHVEIAFLP